MAPLVLAMASPGWALLIFLLIVGIAGTLGIVVVLGLLWHLIF